MYMNVATNADQPAISKRRVIVLLGAALLALVGFVALSDTGAPSADSLTSKTTNLFAGSHSTTTQLSDWTPVCQPHIVFPAGLQELPQTQWLAKDHSICWCPEVESVSIPASVDRIPNYLFNNCRNLTSVKFVGKGPLATIGASAFAGTSITSIEIPDYITHIYSNAFEYAPITKVTFGSGLKEVAQHAFYGTKLKQVKLPKNAIYYTGLFATFPIGTRAPSPTGIRSQVCKVMGGESCDWTKMECECRKNCGWYKPSHKKY